MVTRVIPARRVSRVSEEERRSLIIRQGFQILKSALRDGEKYQKKDHPYGHDENILPWVYEAGRLTDNLDARPIRVVQNSNDGIEPMSLIPGVRQCLRIRRTCPRNSCA